MSYKVFKVGRGVNAPKKRHHRCKTCGSEIIDFRIERIVNGVKEYYCVHCPIAAFFKPKKWWQWK